MSEWNYTKCAKPFGSQQEARDFMVSRGFAGQILKRDNGGFTAVCPTYPEGYYPDAVSVETIDEAALAAPSRDEHLADSECCAGPQDVTISRLPQ
jgi:hypothetical protein